MECPLASCPMRTISRLSLTSEMEPCGAETLGALIFGMMTLGDTTLGSVILTRAAELSIFGAVMVTLGVVTPVLVKLTLGVVTAMGTTLTAPVLAVSRPSPGVLGCTPRLSSLALLVIVNSVALVIRSSEGSILLVLVRVAGPWDLGLSWYWSPDDAALSKNIKDWKSTICLAASPPVFLMWVRKPSPPRYCLGIGSGLPLPPIGGR